MVVHCGLRVLSHSWECLRWSGGDEWLMFVGGGGAMAKGKRWVVCRNLTRSATKTVEKVRFSLIFDIS